MVLRRIEQAITRLEAVARQSRPEPDRLSDKAADLAKTAESDARLREAVSLSLHQIDALIARHGAGPQP